MNLIDEPPILLHPETDLTELEELAQSIKEQGLIEPIVVRKKGDRYELIAGYRRLMACKKFGIPRILARIVDFDEASALIASAVENIQRTDLDPIAEGKLYTKLMKEHGWTIQEIARKLGKSVGYIKARIDLLDMPEPIQQLCRAKKLQISIVPYLKKIGDENDMILVADDIAKRGFTVESAKHVIDAFIKYRDQLKEAPREEILQKAEEEPIGTCELCRQEKPLKLFRSIVMCDDCYREIMYLLERERRIREGKGRGSGCTEED